MNFRSISDLNHCICQNLGKLPRTIDLVVAIPRSGLLAANMIALHLNVGLTDIDSFCVGRIVSAGKRADILALPKKISEVKHALVVDDSISGGSAMFAAKEKLKNLNFSGKICFMAVYSSTPNRQDVDLIFEVCPTPRVFGWNLMHHGILANTCVDLDGVLCMDPTADENDDGERYINFITNVRPLFRPTVPILAIVSARLEKYRAVTEDWLARHGVQYEHLFLLDMSTPAERQRTQPHAKFKASVAKDLNAGFFIESSAWQSRIIAELWGKPVFSVEDQRIITPSLNEKIVAEASNIFCRPRLFFRRLGAKLLRKRGFVR